MIFPKNIEQPFIMSVYTPDPRPRVISHPNKITTIDYIMVGEQSPDMNLLEALELDWSRIRLVKGKKGIQSVIFKDSGIKIEDILN